MQDILLESKSRQSTFNDYFQLFWSVKVKSSLLRCKAVCLVFDKQERTNSIKDLTRVRRDMMKSNSYESLDSKNSDTLIPGDVKWVDFLANCDD